MPESASQSAIPPISLQERLLAVRSGLILGGGEGGRLTITMGPGTGSRRIHPETLLEPMMRSNQRTFIFRFSSSRYDSPDML